MSTRKCLLMFQDNPIIVAVRNPKDIYDAIHSKSQIIFLLTGNVYNLKKWWSFVPKPTNTCLPIWTSLRVIPR